LYQLKSSEVFNLHSRKEIQMKKVARILGLVIINFIAAVYLLIILGSLFEGEPIPSNLESIGMAVLSGLTLIAVILTWFKRRLGAWLVLIVGILFTIFALITAERNHIIAVMAAGGPLIIGSLLILLSLDYNKSSS
jgi:predicted membrane channel-forming protein YqfA (hemolysin III family)